MAYSNWGALVYQGSKRRTDREDVAVFDDEEKDLPSGARIWANLIRAREKYPDGGQPWHEMSHHAVLGDGQVRLCGYKNRPELWSINDEGEVTAVDLTAFTVGEESDGFDLTFEGEHNGCTFRAEQYDGNMVRLFLTEADGSQWTSTCGFEFGAGWTD